MTSAGQIRPRRYAAEIALPDAAYLPGINQRPHDEGHAHPDSEEIARYAAGDWSRSPRYLFGVDLFNHGFYWEAHEAWESIWIELPKRSVGREILQGLIQTAAALLKHRLGQPDASRMLEERARVHFAAAQAASAERAGGAGFPARSVCGLGNPHILGVDVQRVLDDLKLALARPEPHALRKGEVVASPRGFFLIDLEPEVGSHGGPATRH